MKKSKSLYDGHRFPAEVIRCAVRWYFRFQLSLRDIEALHFERGVIVTYETFPVRVRQVWQRLCSSGESSPTKQPGREPPSTDTRTRASHARLSQPETHTTISLVLRADSATFRAEAACDTRLALSQTTCSPVRCVERIQRTCQKSVGCLLNGRHTCRPAVSLSAS